MFTVHVWCYLDVFVVRVCFLITIAIYFMFALDMIIWLQQQYSHHFVTVINVFIIMNISFDCLTYEHSEHPMNHFTDCKCPIKIHGIFGVHFIIIVIIVISVCVFVFSCDIIMPQIHPSANQSHTHIFDFF